MVKVNISRPAGFNSVFMPRYKRRADWAFHFSPVLVGGAQCKRERWNDLLNEIPVNACAIALRFGFYKLHIVLGCERYSMYGSSCR